MKRTSNIQLNAFRKHLPNPKKTVNYALKPLSLAVAIFSLAACSSQKEEVLIVKNAEECFEKTNLSLEQCQAAYKKALAEAEKTGPKYSREALCEVDFGDNQCQRTSSGFFMPFMAGYMVSSLLNRNNFNQYGSYYNPVYNHHDPYYAGRSQIKTADGRVLGKPGQSSYKVSSYDLKPKPKTHKTVSRGGFGSTAAAKSNWGGGKSSRSWGG